MTTERLSEIKAGILKGIPTNKLSPEEQDQFWSALKSVIVDERVESYKRKLAGYPNITPERFEELLNAAPIEERVLATQYRQEYNV